MMTSATRGHKIKLVHIGKASLGLAEDDYRGMVAAVAGGRTDSSAQLDESELDALLARMAARGFKVQPKAKPATGPRTAPYMPKLRALWWALADVGAVTRPDCANTCQAAVEAWAKGRIKGLQALRFAKAAQVSDLVEQLKAWCHRAGAKVQ